MLSRLLTKKIIFSLVILSTNIFIKVSLENLTIKKEENNNKLVVEHHHNVSLEKRALRFGKCSSEITINAFKTFEAKEDPLKSSVTPSSDGQAFLESLCEALEKQCNVGDKDKKKCEDERKKLADGILGEKLVESWNNLKNDNNNNNRKKGGGNGGGNGGRKRNNQRKVQQKGGGDNDPKKGDFLILT